MTQKAWYDDVVWRTKDGDVVSCIEKLRVMSENFREIEQLCQDAFEDALLMGCGEDQVRAAFMRVIVELKNPYRKD
jgi:hypothetical protein